MATGCNSSISQLLYSSGILRITLSIFLDDSMDHEAQVYTYTMKNGIRDALLKNVAH